MSTAAVHLRSPINSSSVQTPDSPPPPPFHQNSLPHFNADNNLNPSSVASSASTGRGRSRPRLAKLRKQSVSQHARSRSRTATASAAGSGFNPFRSASEGSDQVTGNISLSNGFVEGSRRVETGAGACDGGSSSCHRKFGDAGFVFGARRDDPASARDFREDSRSSVNGGEGKVEKEMEFRNSGTAEFVFSAKRSDTESKSQRKTGENAARTVSGGGNNSELEQGEISNRGFACNADQSNLVSSSNTEKGKAGESVESLGVDDGGERKCKTGVECERKECFVFVFGDDHSGKTPSFNVEKQEFLDSMKKLNHGMGAFSTKTETNSNSEMDAGQCDHLGDDDKYKSGYGSTNGIYSTYSNIPAYNLPDEMKKLNINHSEGSDVTGDLTNSHVNSSTCFVFGESEKACGYFSASSGANTGGQQSCTASENIGGQNLKACKANDFQNGTGCGIACGTTRVPFSKPSSSQEGIRDYQCGKVPECYVPEDSKVSGAAVPCSSSFGLDSHQNNYASTGHSSSADHCKHNDCFTSIPEASNVSFMDFKPPAWDPSSFKDNLFPKLNKTSESTQKVRSSKEKGSKHMRRKLKPHSLNKKQTRLDHLSKEDSSAETPDCAGSNSPMDFSPYRETGADNQDVKASEELNDQHSTVPTDYKGEHLTAVGRSVDTNTTDLRCADPDNDKLFSCNGTSSVGNFHSSGPGIVWPSLKTEHFSNSSTAGASADAGTVFSSNSERQKADLFCFIHGLGDSKEKDFSFSASSTVEGTSSLGRKQKKKFRRKKGSDSFVISPKVNGNFGSSLQFSPLTTDQSKEGDFAYSNTIQEACEKWRLRGNQAHKDGDLSKAEDFYTLGINSVPSSERSGCWIKPLLLCYSNRAATRMSLGRIREALGDCMMATALDPTFLKVHIRIANCHLLLGEVENAQQCFSKFLESGNVCLDRRVTLEAAEGSRKAQKVLECINNASELLKERTSDAVGTALELLTKALSISLYSERLLQMKAEALCLLQKYDAAIQLCEQSQYLADKNFATADSVNSSSISMCDSYSCVKLWRWSLISKCYFHLGRLEASLNVLEKLQQAVSVNDKYVTDSIEDSLSLAATIQELLEHKNAGNENFKLGKYREAVENYTVALSSNIKSRPFAAICFCNRAAAHQALGLIADAIADCSMAMALDGNYAKAISRRATLHEMVRDYEQAACDLRRLISVLETKSNEKTKSSDSPSGSNGVKESRQAHQRLLSVEDQAKKEVPLDFYLILGIKPADTATDIKKAYHKAALKHHPDKAGQLLPRSEVGYEGQVWKEITQEVHNDADRLFKMIGEAYAVLSDPAKRSEYDLEDEIRKASKQSNRGGTCKKSSDFYGYGRPSDGYRSPFDRTSNRRYGRDHWKTYGHSYSRW